MLDLHYLIEPLPILSLGFNKPLNKLLPCAIKNSIIGFVLKYVAILYGENGFNLTSILTLNL